MLQTVQSMGDDMREYFGKMSNERPLRWQQIVTNECVNLIERTNVKFAENDTLMQTINTFLQSLKQSEIQNLFVLFGDVYMEWFRPSTNMWTKTSLDHILEYIAKKIRKLTQEVRQYIRVVVDAIKAQKNVLKNTNPSVLSFNLQTIRQIKQTLNTDFQTYRFGEIPDIFKREIEYLELIPEIDPSEYIKSAIESRILSPAIWSCIHLMESQLVENLVFLLCVRYINARRSIQSNEDLALDTHTCNLISEYFQAFKKVASYTYAMHDIGMNIDLLSTLREMMGPSREYNHSYGDLLNTLENTIYKIFITNDKIKAENPSICDLQIKFVNHYYEIDSYDTGNVIELEIYSTNKSNFISLIASYALYDMAGNALYFELQYRNKGNSQMTKQHECVDLPQDVINNAIHYIDEDRPIVNPTDQIHSESDDD